MNYHYYVLVLGDKPHIFHRGGGVVTLNPMSAYRYPDAKIAALSAAALNDKHGADFVPAALKVTVEDPVAEE